MESRRGVQKHKAGLLNVRYRDCMPKGLSACYVIVMMEYFPLRQEDRNCNAGGRESNEKLHRDEFVYRNAFTNGTSTID